MAEADAGQIHISSAIVRAMPGRVEEVVVTINAFPECEVFHTENGRIVVVLEAETAGAVGARLAEIALLDGVVSANLVYEHLEMPEQTASPEERT